MSKPSPYRFDVQFDANECESDHVPMIAVSEHEALIAVKERKSYERGLQDGKSQEQETQQKRLIDQNNTLLSLLEKLLDKITQDFERHEASALSLANHAALKLSEELAHALPVQSLENVLKNCLIPLQEVPQLVIKVRADDAEKLESHIDSFKKEKGFEGKIIFLSEPDFEVGRCEVEWAQGGFEINQAHMRQHIHDMISAYIWSQFPHLKEDLTQAHEDCAPSSLKLEKEVSHG